MPEVIEILTVEGMGPFILHSQYNGGRGPIQ